ncbi:MAG: hypothetical protein ACE148_15905 [Vicinamibacterales bacterium]
MMKRDPKTVVAALAVLILSAAVLVAAGADLAPEAVRCPAAGTRQAASAGQPVYKVTFPFQAGGRKFPSGEYSVLMPAEGANAITLKQEATGKEFQVPFTDRLPQPSPPVTEPKIVFDEVGDFAPSYTEYITVYILSEVWFPGQDGFRTHTTKGAHNTKTAAPIKR